MFGYAVERHVPGEPAAVRVAIADLVQRQWGDRGRTVVDGACDERVDAIASTPGADADVWLTWRLTATGRETLVQLRLDELDRGPDPTAALHALLELLVDAITPAAGD
jgi:hypothetical protein